MKINMLKQPGGILTPATDIDAEMLTKFKTGLTYPVSIPFARNPEFHSKVFAFFNFCFEHWKGDNEFQSEPKQFDVFRKHLTVLAGYYDSFVGIGGKVRVEAKSLSYASMSQEDFEELYSALINAAVKHIFSDLAGNLTEDKQKIYNQLLEFF